MSAETRRKAARALSAATCNGWDDMTAIDAVTAHMRDELAPKTGWQPAGPPPIEVCEHKYPAERCIYTQCKHHPQPTPAKCEEHPEDRASRLEGEEYGRAHAAQFIAQHPTEIGWLISTYADSRAQEDLEALRERFWARMWVPASVQPSPTTEAPETIAIFALNLNGAMHSQTQPIVGVIPVQYTRSDVVEKRVAEARAWARGDMWNRTAAVLGLRDGESCLDAARRVVAEAKDWANLVGMVANALGCEVSDVFATAGRVVAERDALAKQLALMVGQSDELQAALVRVRELEQTLAATGGLALRLEIAERELGEARAEAASLRNLIDTAYELAGKLKP